MSKEDEVSVGKTMQSQRVEDLRGWRGGRLGLSSRAQILIGVCWGQWEGTQIDIPNGHVVTEPPLYNHTTDADSGTPSRSHGWSMNKLSTLEVKENNLLLVQIEGTSLGFCVSGLWEYNPGNLGGGGTLGYGSVLTDSVTYWLVAMES